MSSPLVPGALFGRYAILEIIGRGGMGIVYRARDARLQRVVALKILHGEQTLAEAPSRQHARLLSEARAAAAIEHPNAVAIFDVGEVEGVPFLAMEHIKGRTLRSHIGGGATEVDLACTWLVGVARGLAAAHDRGLLHRDIKPENVMVTEDGTVKVLDFGIAAASRALDDGEAAPPSSPDSRGAIPGTPGYKSPEQIRGERLDGRSDQFAWGVLAYELLSGARPWSHESVGVLASKTLAYAPPTLRERGIGVPEAVEAIVMRALSLDRAARFASMHEIIAALDARPRSRPPPPIRASEPDHAPNIAKELPAPIPPLRSRAPIVAALLALAVAGTGVALFVHRARPAGQPVTSTPAAGPSATAGRASEAMVAYQMGLQAFRDASNEAAQASLDTATRLDDSLASAHLLAVIASNWPSPQARSHYLKAIQFRASLDDRQKVLLDALEGYMRVPQDLDASERTLSAGTERYRDDATMHYLSALIRSRRGKFRESIAECEEALRVDPAFAAAIRLKAYGLVELGETDAGLRTYDACLATSPAATLCLRQQLLLLQAEGRCDDALANSRRLIAVDPGRAQWHYALAETLLSTGAPRDSVRLAAERCVALLPPSAAREKQLELEASLAIAGGELVEAGRLLVARGQELASSNEENDHVWIIETRMEVALEAGLSGAASEIAGRFLNERAAWVPIYWIDTRIWAWVAQYRAGTLPKRDFDEKRSRWLAAERTRAVGPFGSAPGLRWTIAYAAATTNASDAREALDVLPSYAPLPDAMTRTPDYDVQIGQTFLLAGRPAEALPFLSRAAKACYGLEYAIDIVRAVYLEGDALWELGEHSKACAAYREAIARWGNARPRSVTADKAKRRLAERRCAN